MKIHLYSAFIFLSVVLINAQSPAEVRKQLEDCETELGIAKGAMVGPQDYDDLKVKCYQACIMKKFGSMVNGKVIVEKAIEITLKLTSGKPPDTFIAGMSKCANKANEEKEECEVAGSFKKCVMENHVIQ